VVVSGGGHSVTDVSEASVMVFGGREAELSSLRPLRVVLPSGEAYWTVVDDEYRVVAAGRPSSTRASWRCF
jgi:hypothetical protein